MARRGPPPKPTRVRVHEGDLGKLGRKKLESMIAAEPDPAPAPLVMPLGLSPWGQKQWTVITEELDRLNLLAGVDHGALESAIRGGDMAVQADAQLQKLMNRVKRNRAADKDWYHISIMNNVSKKGWTQFKNFCTEFGCTPASRSRLTVDPSGGSGAPSAAKKADSIEMVLCG